MIDKITKTMLLIILGWMLGYMQHFMTTRDMMKDFSGRIFSLEQKTTLMNTGISEIFQEVSVMNLKFESRKDFKVTGYSNDPGSINVPRWRDGMTATGVKATTGICAADWNVLPVDTMVWVPGYGWCNIQDRGSQVKGNHIDLFFNKVADARQWGVKQTDIIISRN